MRLSRNAISTLGLLAAATCVPAYCLAANAQYVQWGNQMLQQKKYDEAIKYFTGAAKADAKDAAAYKGMGYAYAYKGDKAKALQYLKYSLQLNPSDTALSTYVSQLGGSSVTAAAGGAGQALQYGNYYYQQKNYDAAIGWYNKATQAEPNNARAWQALGNAYYGKQDKANAIAAWDKAVALDPSNTQLAAYVAQLKGTATASSEPAASTQAEAPATVSTPGVNPWVMGGTVAVLGAIMLFVF